MRRSHIGSLCHGSVVSCERIGVDHLSVGKVGRNTCVGVIVPHGIAGRGRVPGQRQSGVILPRHLDTVRLARQGDVDRFAVESDLLDRRQILVSGVFHLPVPMSVVGNAHRIIAPSEKRFLYVFIPRRRTMQEIAPYGDTTGLIRIVQVVVGQSETVMPGAQRPVPVLVFGALSAVEFHDPVTAEFLHEAFRRARRSQGVIHLDEIGLLSEQV